MSKASSSSKVVLAIWRKTLRGVWQKTMLRTTLDSLRGEESIEMTYRREGRNTRYCYRWSREFLKDKKK